MRRLGTAAFAALAAATVGAFFVSQHLKVSDPLISGYPHTSPPVIAPALSGCGGRYRQTRLSFYLQHSADDVAVSIITPAGGVVRTLVRRRHMARNVRSMFTWDGRAGTGALVADGRYAWRIALLGQNRTIQIATPITVRNTPPQPRVVSITPGVVPIAGSGSVTIRFAGVAVGDRVTAQIYRASAHGPALLLTSFLVSGRNQARWNTRIRGRPTPPGTYLVALTAVDAACGSGRAPAAASPPVRVGSLPAR